MTDLRKAAQQALEALHYGKANKAVTILREALAQPVQEPVTCRFCHDARGCWTWQCYHCGEIDDVQQPAAPPVQEPAIGDIRGLKHRIHALEGEVIGYKKILDALPMQDPVAYDKTEMNSFVIDLYDKKMKEGKHGHYEALFHCVHQAIKRAAHGIKENT